MKTKTKTKTRKNYLLTVDAALLCALAGQDALPGAALIYRVASLIKVPNSTAYAVLGKLAKAKLVAKKGTGKGSTYRITASGKQTVQELAEVLDKLVRTLAEGAFPGQIR